MQVQTLFEEKRAHAMHALMQRYSLGSVIVMTSNGIEAKSVPVEVDTSSGEFGTLRCYFGRSDPLGQKLIQGMEALVIFQGPNAYIAPRR